METEDGDSGSRVMTLDEQIDDLKGQVNALQMALLLLMRQTPDLQAALASLMEPAEELAQPLPMTDREIAAQTATLRALAGLPSRQPRRTD